MLHHKIRVVLDTTPILGRGAVQDTYNLLGEGIKKLGRRLWQVQGVEEKTGVQQQGLERYFGSSLKGEAALDWDDKGQREQLLTQIVTDARRLLSWADQVKQEQPEQAAAIETDAALLRRLITQDVEEKANGGCQVKQGTAPDRMVSVHDPEMRHGRKSASKRFNGHKAAVAVDVESQLIGAVEVLAGNAGDQEKALELVEQVERVLQMEVEETIGDCAYGGGPTRRRFVEQQRTLTAKVPVLGNGNCFPKTDFAIDLEKMEVRCPAGHISHDYRSAGEGRGGRFEFPTATCATCPLRPQCVRGKGPRTISIQAEEALLQQARIHNQSEAGRKSLRERVVVEHRLARLVQLGIRKSRYRGKKKTRWQVVIAAVVANVSLVAGYVKRKLNPTPANPASPAPAVKAPPQGFLCAGWKVLQRLLAIRLLQWA